MKIKTLNIKAFGKFKDKTIDFEPGLNLVQGNNETGKTTIQTFIQGMFFGFYKPYRKKKTYGPEYEKYMPWEQFEYAGSLIYEVDGREIRLERNFLRGQDSLVIYDNITGEDITGNFKYDGVIRQHLPLGEWGMTPGIYNNTMNIRQLPAELESGSQEEIRQYYQGLQNSGGSDMSFSGIVRRLEEKKKNIGRSGQSKSRIGAATRKRDELLLALKEGEEAYKKVAANQETITRYQKRMAEIEAENEYLVQESVVNRKREILQTYEKIEALEKENADLSQRIKELKGFEGFNYKTLERLKTIRNQIERLSDQINYIEKEMDELDSQIKSIRKKEESKRQVFAGKTWEGIRDDYETFYKMEAVPEEGKQQSRFLVNFSLISLIILGIGLAGTMMNGTLALEQGLEGILLILGMIMIAGGIVGFIGVGAARAKKRRARESGIINPTQEMILKKYGIQSPEEYEKYYKKAARTQKELEQMQNEGELLIVQQSRRQAGFEVLYEQRRGILKDFSRQLQEHGVKTLEIYIDGCRKSQELEEVTFRFNTNLRLLEGLYEIVNAGKIPGGNGFWEKAAPKADELLSLGKEIARLEGENNSLMEAVSLPVETREALRTLNSQIAACDLEIRACDAALNIIETIQKDSHHESAPELNHRIGNILGDITRHYQGVKIDETMKIKVVDPQSGNFKDAEQLSAGTMDQVHFAFRCGISGVLDSNMPFVLDEPFVRYDHQRKTQALGLLAELSQSRQVILFACGEEEAGILDEMSFPYHRIQLL